MGPTKTPFFESGLQPVICSSLFLVAQPLGR